MADPFLGEIRITSFGFAPVGWAFCNGQLLPINQNQALFAILGTTYGGNGIQNFALPNLQGRAAMHMGSGNVLGQSGGEASVSLTAAQTPAHQHAISASTDFANSASAQGNVWAAKSRGGVDAFAPAGTGVLALAAGAVGATGQGQAHENMQPYLALNFIIALQGIFPSQN